MILSTDVMVVICGAVLLDRTLICWLCLSWVMAVVVLV